MRVLGGMHVPPHERGCAPRAACARVCLREREREGARRCPRSSVRVPECMRLCHQEGHVWACECVRGTLRDAVKMARVRESTAANQGQVRACVCTCVCAYVLPHPLSSPALPPLRLPFLHSLSPLPPPLLPRPRPISYNRHRSPPSLPPLSLLTQDS